MMRKNKGGLGGALLLLFFLKEVSNMGEKHIKIKQSDWRYIYSALVTFWVEPFQSKELQDKVEKILKKYE